MQTVENTQEIIPITPIKELVAGHTVKVQVNVDEDATDNQILVSLDDACKNWEEGRRIQMAVYMIVGKLLVAVKERGIYLQEEFGGSMENFLKWIEKRHGMGKQSAYNAMSLVQIPKLTLDRAEKIGPTNVFEIAKAVKKLKVDDREKVAERWLAYAEKKPSGVELKEKLQKAGLRKPPKTATGMTRISFEVSAKVAEDWLKFVGENNQGEVFTNAFHDYKRSHRLTKTAIAS